MLVGVVPEPGPDATTGPPGVPAPGPDGTPGLPGVPAPGPDGTPIGVDGSEGLMVGLDGEPFATVSFLPRYRTKQATSLSASKNFVDKSKRSCEQSADHFSAGIPILIGIP